MLGPSSSTAVFVAAGIATPMLKLWLVGVIWLQAGASQQDTLQ